MLRHHYQRWMASGLLASQFFLGGCQAQQRTNLDGFRPDFTTLLKLPGSETAVVRGQKAATTAPVSYLEMGPDSAGNKDQRSARIRATVNGEAILEEEIVAAAIQGLIGARTEAEKNEIMKSKLNEIIERELLMQDAITRLNKKGGQRFMEELEKIADREFEKQWLHKLMRANKVSDPDLFKRMLRDQGLPVDLVRRQWIRSFIAMEYLRSRIEPQLNKVGHEQIQDYYEKHPEEFKVDDSIIWQDIFIANARHPNPQAARKFAEVLVERIRKGEDFARLAKEFDNGDSSLRENAEGLGRKRGEVFPREAEDLLFRMQEGEIGPLVEIETGYHIIRLMKRTQAGLTPFNDATQKLIRDKLKNQVFQQEMRKLINDLKRLAIIDIATEVR
ncbi:MAG: peptidylprolyl isomerase [Gemmataceae bacterium]